MRAVVSILAFLLAVSIGGINALSYTRFQYIGTLTSGADYFEIIPPAPNLIFNSLLRLELNATVAPISGLTGKPMVANLQAIVRDPQHTALTTVNSRVGAVDSSVSLVCPSALVPNITSGTGNTNYSLVITGTVGTSYLVRVNFVSGDLTVDDPAGPLQTLVSDNKRFKLYFFELTPEQAPPPNDEGRHDSSDGNSVKIEVVSDSYDLTYLYIAPDTGVCVTEQSIQTASNTTARLTFSHNATFTLSRGSAPAISSGRWYIAVIGRNLTGLDIKYITIAVSVGFDYDYSYAICMTLLLPCAIAIVILVATHCSGGLSSTVWFSLSPPPRNAPTKPSSVDREPFSCGCLRKHVGYWFLGRTTRGNTFSWHTLILACGFGVAVYQVVFLQWRTQQLTGDRDTCTYNERCYRPHPYWDVPWNNIISNFPYMILGLAFIVHTALYQWERPAGDFSLFYAMGWGLMTEGAFSLFYHVCPTVPIFQFDTAFMFVIALLCLLAVYQNGEGDYVPQPRDAPHINDYFKEAHFFLFAIIPLWIFNYLGALFDTDQVYGSGNYIAFWVCVCVWETCLFAYVGYRFVDPRKHRTGDEYGVFSSCCTHTAQHPNWCAKSGGFLVFGAMWAGYIIWSILVAYTRYSKVAGMFLIKCLLASFLGLARVSPIKRAFGLDPKPGDPRVWGRCVGLSGLVVTFVGLMLTALYYFVSSTTDKNYESWVSRTLNSDCADVSGYFDLHDLWHILGAFGLFLNFNLLLYMNPPPNRPVKSRHSQRQEQKDKTEFIDNWRHAPSDPTGKVAVVSPSSINEMARPISPPAPQSATAAAAGSGGVAMAVLPPAPAPAAAAPNVSVAPRFSLHFTPGTLSFTEDHRSDVVIPGH